jgi:hypothetical protein
MTLISLINYASNVIVAAQPREDVYVTKKDLNIKRALHTTMLFSVANFIARYGMINWHWCTS